jgi:hypothetical protein
MELQIIKRETITVGNVVDNEVITKFEIMDGARIKSKIKILLPKLVFKKKFKILDWLNKTTRMSEIAIPILYLLNGIIFII